MQRQRINTEKTEKQQQARERRIHSGEGSLSAMNRMRSQEDAKSRYGLAGWQQRELREGARPSVRRLSRTLPPDPQTPPMRPETQLELFGS
jgi:hypothetical protein